MTKGTKEKIIIAIITGAFSVLTTYIQVSRSKDAEIAPLRLEIEQRLHEQKKSLLQQITTLTAILAKSPNDKVAAAELNGAQTSLRTIEERLLTLSSR